MWVVFESVRETSAGNSKERHGLGMISFSGSQRFFFFLVREKKKKKKEEKREEKIWNMSD
jgi:hypothetical protein